jgi:hypothetical protein
VGGVARVARVVVTRPGGAASVRGDCPFATIAVAALHGRDVSQVAGQRCWGRAEPELVPRLLEGGSILVEEARATGSARLLIIAVGKLVWGVG